MANRIKTDLTEAEVARFLKAAKTGRYGVRDYAMMLVCYRHGFRVSELIDLRKDEVDLGSAHIQVRRLKGSMSTKQVMEGDELRAVRAWIREQSVTQASASSFLFTSERGDPFTRQAINYLVRVIGERAGFPFRVHPHMLRHSCGFALANRGLDTRLVQDALGHKNIAHTVRYTRTAAKRFEGMWRKGGA